MDKALEWAGKNSLPASAAGTVLSGVLLEMPFVTGVDCITVIGHISVQEVHCHQAHRIGLTVLI